MQFTKSFTIFDDGRIEISSTEDLAVTRTALLAKSGPELNTLFEQLTGTPAPVRNEGREPKVNRIMNAMTRRAVAQPLPKPEAPSTPVADPAPQTPAAPADDATTPEETEDMAARKKTSKTKTKAKTTPRKRPASGDKELTPKQAAALKKVPKDGQWRSSHQLGILIAHCKALTEKGYLKARDVEYGTQGKVKTQYALRG